jgi:hypothetical protein
MAAPPDAAAITKVPCTTSTAMIAILNSNKTHGGNTK